MLCPKCKTDRAGRSHRRGLLEHMISAVGYYPYSCRDCHRRFLSPSSKRETPSAPVRHNVEREIRATREALKAPRKRRELILYAAAIVLFLGFLYYLTRDRSEPVEGGARAPLPCPYAECRPTATA